MAQKNIQQIMAELQDLYQRYRDGRGFSPGTDKTQLSQVASELARFLATGSVDGLSRPTMDVLNGVLRGTSWEGQPTYFYTQVMQTDTAKAQADRAAGVVPNREYHGYAPAQDPRAQDNDLVVTQQARKDVPNMPSMPGGGQGSVGNYAMSLVNRDDPKNKPPYEPVGAGNRQAPGTGKDEPQDTATINQGRGTATAPAQPTNPTGGLGGSTATGGFNGTPAQATLLTGSDDQYRLMAMLREMGYNPAAPGNVGKMLAQKLLSPGLDSILHLLPFANGGNGMSTDDMGTAGAMQQFARSLMQKGGNPFADIRALATQAQGNPAFMQMLGDMTSDDDQNQALQFLSGAGSFGLSPMVRQSIADRGNRNYTNFNLAQYDAAGGQGTPSRFLAWLQGQPEAVRRNFLGN